MPAHHRTDGAVKPESDCRGVARGGAPQGPWRSHGDGRRPSRRGAPPCGALFCGLQGVKKVVQMPICPLLSPFLLRETVLY